MSLFLRETPASGNGALELEVQTYNRRVLQHQDEAFALAADLLRDEVLSAEVVQAVFVQAFPHGRQPEPEFRWVILRGVIRACQERPAGDRPSGLPRLETALDGLTNEQRVVLLLVDRLDLSYTEAAAVVRKPLGYIRGTLGVARGKLSEAYRLSLKEI